MVSVGVVAAWSASDDHHGAGDVVSILGCRAQGQDAGGDGDAPWNAWVMSTAPGTRRRTVNGSVELGTLIDPGVSS